jgi:ribosomal-protein-alanine N-acetyltransferase
MASTDSQSADQPRSFTGSLHPIVMAELDEVWQLDLRCFVDGESYERETFRYLLSNPNTISRQIRDNQGVMVAFIITVIEMDGVGHIIAIGVEPEYRRHGLARILLTDMERTLRRRGIATIRLEVRVENSAAINLYEQLGYLVVQRLGRYYSSGADGYMMVKSLG